MVNWQDQVTIVTGDARWGGGTPPDLSSPETSACWRTELEDRGVLIIPELEGCNDGDTWSPDLEDQDYDCHHS